VRCPARPALFAGALFALLFPVDGAAAQQMDPSGEVIMFTVGDATLADLLSTPGFLALANRGGAGLVVTQDAGDFQAGRADAAEPTVAVRSVDYGSVAGSDGTASPEKPDAAAASLEVELEGAAAGPVGTSARAPWGGSPTSARPSRFGRV